MGSEMCIRDRLVATLMGAAAVLSAHYVIGVDLHTIIRLIFDGIVFCACYAIVLRMLFPASLGELLDVAPGGIHVSRIMRLPTNS